MKVKLLTSLVRDKASYGAGETIEVKDNEAVRMIERKLAVATNKKQFETLLEKLEKEKTKEEEQQKLLQAQLQKEKLEAELNALYEQVVEKEALLAGVVLSDEEKFKLIEELKNREVESETETNK